jgi:hypothetical protein
METTNYIQTSNGVLILNNYTVPSTITKDFLTYVMSDRKNLKDGFYEESNDSKEIKSFFLYNEELKSIFQSKIDSFNEDDDDDDYDDFYVNKDIEVLCEMHNEELFDGLITKTLSSMTDGTEIQDLESNINNLIDIYKKSFSVTKTNKEILEMILNK